MAPRPTILLVEDDPHVRQALREVLLSEDYDVSEAASGLEAVRQLQASDRGPVDAAVMALAAGADGWTVFEGLISLVPSLPIIVLTSSRDEVLPPWARQRVALMSKPLDLAWLCRALRQVLAVPPTSAQNENELGGPPCVH
jgi:CheY-like chemotaxis protein